MLLCLAHEAEVCPRCRAKLPRNAEPAEDGVKRYRCSHCELQFAERDETWRVQRPTQQP